MSKRSWWPTLLALLLAAAAAMAALPSNGGGPVVTITQAEAVASGGERYPDTLPAQAVRLPDDWSQTRPRYDGSVWYRASFDAPPGAGRDELVGLYIDRVCTNLDVFLNG